MLPRFLRAWLLLPALCSSEAFPGSEASDSCALLQTQARAVQPQTENKGSTQLEGNVGQASQVADLLARDAMSLVTQLERLHTALDHAAAQEQLKKKVAQKALPVKLNDLLAASAQAGEAVDVPAALPQVEKAVDVPVALSLVTEAPQENKTFPASSSVSSEQQFDISGWWLTFGGRLSTSFAPKAVDAPVALPQVTEAPQDNKTVPATSSVSSEQQFDISGDSLAGWWLTFGGRLSTSFGAVVWVMIAAASSALVCMSCQSFLTPVKPKIGKPDKAARTSGWDYH